MQVKVNIVLLHNLVLKPTRNTGEEALISIACAVLNSLTLTICEYWIIILGNNDSLAYYVVICTFLMC